MKKTLLFLLAALTLLIAVPAVHAQRAEGQSFTKDIDIESAKGLLTPDYAKPYQGKWQGLSCPAGIGVTIVINGEYTQLVNLATSPSEVQAHIGAIAAFSQVTKGVEFTYQNLTNQFLNFKLTAVDGKLVGTFTIQDSHGSALITAPVTFVPNTPAYKGDLGMFLSSKEGTCSAK